MSVTDDILASYAPLLNTDSEAYLTPLAGMFEQVFGVVADQGYADDADWVPGWGTLLDPDTCPVAFLPYLGQFNGTSVDPSTVHDDYATTVLADKPIGYWRFNEQPGAITAADSAGSHPGTYIGSQFPNKITNGSFETNTTGWTTSNCAVAADATQHSPGAKSAKLTSTASGTMNINNDTAPLRVPATAQVTYTASCVFRAASTTRTCNITLYFQDASGSRLATNVSGAGPDSNTNWGAYSITARAPANTATASVALNVLSTGASNEVHYVDGVILSRDPQDEPYSDTQGVSLQTVGALAGDPNMGMTVDGQSGYINVPYDAALNPPKFTYEVWINPTVNTSGSIFNTLYGSSKKGIWLYLSSGYVHIRLGDGVATNDSGGLTTISTGAWVHVAMTYDGTTATLYVNGQVRGTFVNGYSPSTDYLDIGGNLAGSLDEATIYDHPLSATQLVTHYQAGASGSTRSIIKAEAGFDRGTPASIITAAQTYLTGTKNVQIIERLADGGTLDAWHFQLIVKTSEVVDATKLTAAVNAVKPVGITWTLVSTTGHPWSTATKIWSNETVSWADTDNVAI